jgi:hypothetical protein
MSASRCGAQSGAAGENCPGLISLKRPRLERFHGSASTTSAERVCRSEGLEGAINGTDPGVISTRWNAVMGKFKRHSWKGAIGAQHQTGAERVAEMNAFA